MAGKSKSARSGRGFTLLELLVVIFIVAVAVALLYPVFAQVRERGRQVVCLSQVRQHARAILMYSQDYDERLPIAWNQSGSSANWDESLYPRWWNVIEPYVRDPNVFRCPDDAGYMGMKDGDPLNNKSFFAATGSSYSSFIGWLPVSDTTLDSRLPRYPGGLGGLSLAAVINPARAAVSYDSSPFWHSYIHDLTLALSDETEVNVAFLDGSAGRRSSLYVATYLVQGPGATDGSTTLALGDQPVSNPGSSRISTAGEARSLPSTGVASGPGSNPDVPAGDQIHDPALSGTQRSTNNRHQNARIIKHRPGQPVPTWNPGN